MFMAKNVYSAGRVVSGGDASTSAAAGAAAAVAVAMFFLRKHTSYV
jgi:hypothetical protein